MKYTCLLLLLITSCSYIKHREEESSTYSYFTGTLKSQEAAALPLVFTSTLAALKNLEFTVQSEKRDALTGHISALTAHDQSVNIRIEKEKEARSSIHIRVGALGDQKIAQFILEEIHKNLAVYGR